MRTHHAILVAALALAPMACSSDLNIAPQPPSTIAGTWTHTRGANEPIVFFMQWNLSVIDTVITGTGHWAGEAGPSGPVAVRGYYSKGNVHLDLDLRIELPTRNLPGFHRVFDGVLTSPTDLVGTSTNDDQTFGTEHMHKGSVEP